MNPLLPTITVAIVISAASAPSVTAATSPQAAADALLAADRTFAAAAAKTDLISGISAQFDENVIMPLPGGKFAEGKEAAIAALKGNPDNPTSRVEWTPVRVGVSADGQHGFSFGFMTIHKGGGKPAAPAKYLSYWVKTPHGWRVAAYKRAGRPDGQISTALMAPSLPAAMTPVSTDSASRAAHERSLAAAEKSFSDESQTIGLGPAFTKYGRADAMNMGQDAGFAIGNEVIGGQSGEDGRKPSPVYWSADKVLVASSGDLGVNFGVIRPHTPEEGRPNESAFFTIWRRDSVDQPWRYIAE